GDAVGIASYLIPRVAADEAVGLGDNAANPRAAVAPRYRTAAAVAASDHVVPVAQGVDATDIISGVTADKAVRIRDRTADAAITVGPGDCPAIAVPVPALNNVVAVVEERCISHLIPGVAADEAIGFGDDAV